MILFLKKRFILRFLAGNKAETYEEEYCKIQ